MVSTYAPVVPILRAERSNGSRPTEDRIFTTKNAVMVLDGASQPEPTERNGAWIADQLGADLAKRLSSQPHLDLGEALESSIRQVTQQYEIRPNQSPSTTVAMVRWDASMVDVLVLCDSPVVVVDRSNGFHFIRDDRLDAIGKGDRPAIGFRTENPELWKELVDFQRSRRNQPEGYWVAEAVPEAARHAIRASFPFDEVAMILAMTDGVSAGVDCYGVPADWQTAVDIAANEPAKLLDLVHSTEASDPEGRRWPRSKCHDDKAIAVLRFDLAT